MRLCAFSLRKRSLKAQPERKRGARCESRDYTRLRTSVRNLSRRKHTFINCYFRNPTFDPYIYRFAGTFSEFFEKDFHGKSRQNKDGKPSGERGVAGCKLSKEQRTTECARGKRLLQKSVTFSHLYGHL